MIKSIHKTIQDRITDPIRERIENGLDNTRDPDLFSFEWFLSGVSFLYGLGVAFRLFLYKKKIFKSERLPSLVISVGNIAAGGTGKTPMAVYLAELLQKMGKHPVVVSRGYKGRYQGAGLVVSDGERIFSCAEECGDEPFMMAQSRSFPVVVGKKRAWAGRMALEKLDCDTIILDDGFQHMGLARDVNLLLMDCSRPLGNNRLLPLGRLREKPGTAFHRADALVFTRCLQQTAPELPDFRRTGLKDNCPEFTTRHLPFIAAYIGAGSGGAPCDGLSALEGKDVLIFSGIAQNDSFYRTVASSGANIVEHLEFEDHYRYKKADVKTINSKAGEMAADLIVTTQKDWSKLATGTGWNTDIIVIGIRIQFHDEEGFKTFLSGKFK